MTTFDLDDPKLLVNEERPGESRSSLRPAAPRCASLADSGPGLLAGLRPKFDPRRGRSDLRVLIESGESAAPRRGRRSGQLRHGSSRRPHPRSGSCRSSESSGSSQVVPTSEEEGGGRGGCPIANLLGQVGERDAAIRAVLASGYDRWEASIRAGLEAMVASGELRSDADPAWLAASTLASLQGGLILSQAHRDPLALRSALDGALALIGIYRSRAVR